MNRKHSPVLAAITTVLVVVAGAVGVQSAARAEPGEVDSGGMHLVASVDANFVKSTGDLALGVPFSHSAKVSGNFSTSLDGASALRRGKLIAGYLIGCAVDISDGIDVSIAAAVGGNVDVTTGLLGLSLNVPFGVTVGDQVAVDFGGNLGIDLGGDVTFGVFSELGGEITVSINPGSVTAAVIAESTLDEDSLFPFTFAHSNTALNINGCLTPASAMPFITVRADARNGIVQTTGYGQQFVF
ncbi:MspA family porin [Nocardia sp. bgisy134]|uniref:MspA family porin n=1 Tax=unclassified Nocardia TaxID=2637762 RepID=UPI003D73A661